IRAPIAADTSTVATRSGCRMAPRAANPPGVPGQPIRRPRSWASRAISSRFTNERGSHVIHPRHHPVRSRDRSLGRALALAQREAGCVVIAGHFGFAAAVKARVPRAPLWALMLASVWMDVVFIPLFAAKIEPIEVLP